jgi:hypothetical protein
LTLAVDAVDSTATAPVGAVLSGRLSDDVTMMLPVRLLSVG